MLYVSAESVVKKAVRFDKRVLSDNLKAADLNERVMF